MKRINNIVLIIISITALLSFFACSNNHSSGGTDIGTIEIDPGSASAKTESINISLYFSDPTHRFLAAEPRTIKAPVNDKVELFILNTLIDGPEQDNDLGILINPATEVVNISSSGDVLSVVFSSEFLSWPFDTETDQAPVLKTLAVYSVVNTLVENSGYPKVQILVDRDSSGSGQRLQVFEVGGLSNFSSGNSGIVGPLSRDSSVVLSPVTLINDILQSISVKDYKSAYERISYGDTYGYKRPDETAFSSFVLSAPTLEGFSINEEIVSDDGQSAIVMIDYSIRKSDGESLTRTAFPTFVTKENGIWKQKFSDFKKIFEINEADK